MDRKKILFVTSEAVPFIKTGGLADVAGTLPKYFDKEQFDVRVVLPKYACMKPEWKDKLVYKTHFYMDFMYRNAYVGIMECELDGVTFYFIDNEEYFSGNAPYGEIRRDIEKFIYFSKAALSILPIVDFRPEIIHCHDWQTGLVPVYLHDSFQGNPFYWHIQTIMTIHNLKFQGIYSWDVMKEISGLSDYYFTYDKLEAYGDANMLKGGIVFSNRVTTVSDTYANEIKTDFYGERLNGLMNSRADVLSGIVNGIDYDEFNPETDKHIAQTYNIDTVLTEKVKNKLALQKEMGLPENPDVMMIGLVSRLTDQKGLDLIDRVLDEILQDDVQFVVLGTGEARYEDMFRYYAEKYPEKVAANIYYSDPLSHKIYAACDTFLMPSLFEPCGLSQLMSLRYGTIPMVRETGGLADTVEAYDAEENTGTGFSFPHYNAHQMMDMVREAEEVYYTNKPHWNDLVIRAMSKDFSWKSSAVKYQDMYKEMLEPQMPAEEAVEEAAEETEE